MSIMSASSSFQGGRASAFTSQQPQRGGFSQQAQRGGAFGQSQQAQRGGAPQQTQQTQRGFAPQQTQQTQRGTVLNSSMSAARTGASNAASNSSSFCPTCNTAGGRQAPVTGSFGMPTGGQAGGSFCIGCR